MGVSDLKRCKIDNAAGDGNLWMGYFLELKENVLAPSEVNNNRYAIIKNDDYIYITNKNATNT